MSRTFDTVILSAGSVNYTNLPIKTNTSNAIVPVNGKPVISWILDNLIQTHVGGNVIMVVREDDDLIQEFINRVYANRLPIELVSLSESKSILHSLWAGLKNVKSKGVRVVLGDTLVKDIEENVHEDFVYLQEVDDSSRWCLAVMDGGAQVSHYIDKQPNIPKPHYAVCGHYSFSDCQYLLHQTEDVIRSGKKQISDLLLQYQRKYQLQGVFANEWYDFGNPDNFIRAKQKLLQGRFFNSLTIDPVLNTITKVSELDLKLRNELKWYESLPSKLQVLTPRIVSKEQHNGKLYLTQEYYGYPTLAELFLFSNLNVESWESIFKTLMRIHEKFKEYKGEPEVENARSIYQHKTFDRLNAMRDSAEWNSLLSAEAIFINGVSYNGFAAYSSLLSVGVDELVKTCTFSIIHGDYCFSNILYDINSHIARLIDPRGSFGSDGIYGDPRYDIAKLRHSIAGCYDYIVSDLFDIHEEGLNFQFEIFGRADQEMIARKFDEIVSESGYDLRQIKLIEALLFLSMIPYHKDKPRRQKAMFLTGIIRLSEIK
jgi:dTDP-glucose pyrophosphorylase